MADITEACVPGGIQFSNLTGTGDFICEWDFGDGAVAEGCGDISHQYVQTGIYDVSLTVTNAGLCVNTTTINDYIEIIPNPSAHFTFEPSTIFSSEPVVTFNNNSANATNYVWDFGHDNATSMEENPVYTYPELIADQFDVQLVALNDLGCSDTTILTVTIVDEIIFYIPNSFTPDGDSYNQIFKPVMTSGFDASKYGFNIYNRWGELIFTTEDIQSGWDGTYKGKLVQDGVYVWTIYFREQFNDKKHTHSGHVTLIH